MTVLTKPPRLVRWVSDAVSAHLGRPANIRAEKNGRYWFVNDPTFSYLQVGLKGGVTDYRVGFMVESNPSAIAFYTVHTPTIARVFRSNIVFESILGALDQTHQFRRSNLLFYSSRRLARSGGSIARIEAAKYQTFRAQLLAHHDQSNLVKDLFPVLPNQGNGLGKARKAGHDFFLLLADKASSLSRKAQVTAVIEAAWPLFQSLYPKESPRKRDAILAAKLRTAGVLQLCEFNQIKRREFLNIGEACAGRIEGAHIKPDALGGSDEPSNGLWLCQRHHRVTEGLLKGKRGNVYAISTKLFNQADR
jgi:hypothetical protein